VTLSKLIDADLERVRETIEHGDADWASDVLTRVHQQIDTPQQRARLADAITPARSHRRLNRRQTHPRRPPNRRLNPDHFIREIEGTILSG
jgi:hypothetical protein